VARAGFDIVDHADRVDAECIDAILAAGSAVAPSILYNQRLLELYENCDPRDPRNPMYFGPLESAAETEARVRGISEDLENACRRLPEMLAAGVPIVLGDDFGTVLLRHGEFGAEMEFYVKQVGIPVLDVIRWGTRNGAALVDAEGELGTVAPGKIADLLVVDGDPVADIACLGDPSRLLAVVKGGVFMRDELRAQDRRRRV
jgi:imidazolonepropionase-like amidohydrolase